MNISRREFLKYCVSSAAVLGLDATVLGKLEQALAANIGPHVIWLSGASCTGCSVSLANLISPAAPKDIADLFINVINLDYHPNLMGAAGDLAVQTLRKAQAGSYVLAVEGAIPTAYNGNTCILWHENGADVTALAAVKDLASKSIANLSIGTCASFGGISSGKPNPTQAVSLSTAIGKPTINIPGCPTHPDWVVSVIAQLIAGTVPPLDSNGRPTAIFGHGTIHSKCPRREREEANTYGVANLCLEELGCKGPSTMGDCPSRKWNNGLNYCMNANANCVGCTENGYPDKFAPFFRVSTTSTIPAQKALAVSSATWDPANQVLALIGAGKIGAQVVVKNPGGALLASTIIKRDGSWSISKAGLLTVPSSVVVSSGAVSLNTAITNAPGGKAFAITAAQYISNGNQLSVSGTGAAGATVTLNVTGGAVLGAVTIPTTGIWNIAVTSPTPIPTSVTAASNGVLLNAAVTGIPSGTVFTIMSAVYTSSTNRLTINGSGPAGVSVNVSVSGGAALGTATVASNGTWTFSATSPSPIPTSVTAVSGGVTKTAAVSGIPASTSFGITSATYTASTNRISVSGTGKSGSTVNVGITGGSALGSAIVTASGVWSFSIASPTPIPTSIRATSNAVTLTRTVSGIPTVTRPLTVTKARWNRERRRLSLSGGGTAGKSVSIFDDSTSRLLGTSYVNSSSAWSQQFSLSRPPQVIRVVSNGQTVRKSVDGVSSEAGELTKA